MKKMMKKLLVLLLMVAAAYGTKPKCQELTGIVVLKDDADICEVAPNMAGIAAVGNLQDPMTLDFSQADETTLNTFLAKFNKVAGAIVMDGNEQVTTLNLEQIGTFQGSGFPAGDMFILIRNNPKLTKIVWNDKLVLTADSSIHVLVYNNPLLDATSLTTLAAAVNRLPILKPYFQNTGVNECQFEHPLDPADPTKYIAPTAKLLENCKTIKGDFVVKDVSLAGLGHEINLDPSSCLKLINVDMKDVKLAASNYTGTGTCKDGTMSEITGNPNLCGAELEKLHSSYGNNTAVKADPATCTVQCTPDQQSSQGIYFFCLPPTTEDPTTTTEPPTNTTNPAAALIGQPTPGPAKDNTEKTSTMELWKIGVIVGSVILIIVIGVLGFFWWKKKWCCRRSDVENDLEEGNSEPKKVDANKDKGGKKVTSKEKPGSEEVVPGNRAEDHVEPHGALVMDTTQSTTKTHTPVKPEQNEDLKSPANLTGKTKAQEDVVQKPVEEKETKASKEKDDPVKTGTTESKVNVVLEDNKKMTPKKEEQPDALDDHGADLNVEPTQGSEKTRPKKDAEQHLEKNKNETPAKMRKKDQSYVPAPTPNTTQSTLTVLEEAKPEPVTDGTVTEWGNKEFRTELLFVNENVPEEYQRWKKEPERFKLTQHDENNYDAFVDNNCEKHLKDLTGELRGVGYNGEPRDAKEVKADVDKRDDMKARKTMFHTTLLLVSSTLAMVNDGKTSVQANRLEFMDKVFYPAEAPRTTETIENFWKLVVQEGMQSLVMLCKLMENNREKCSAYFPTGLADMTFNSVTVTCLFVARRGTAILQSGLLVTIGEKIHYVDHFQFTEWPDHGVPAIEYWADVFYLYALMTMSGSTMPILVHCSAGVGRTGSFIALYVIMETLKNGEIPDVNAVLKFVRRSRAHAVQTYSQYSYIHAAPMLQCLFDGVITDRKAAMRFINKVVRCIENEKASKEKASKEKASKEKASKEKESNEKTLKEKTLKEKKEKRKRKTKESKEKASKEKASKEKASKEKESNEKASKEKESKEKESKEKESKEKTLKEKKEKRKRKTKESKEKASKEQESKEKEAKERKEKKLRKKKKSNGPNDKSNKKKFRKRGYADRVRVDEQPEDPAV